MRQHQVVADIKEILELGLACRDRAVVPDVVYSFEVFDNDDGTKFIGITVEGHTEDLDEMSEWSIQPERV